MLLTVMNGKIKERLLYKLYLVVTSLSNWAWRVVNMGVFLFLVHHEGKVN